MQNNDTVTSTNHIPNLNDTHIWEYHVISERRTHPDMGIYRAYGIHAFEIKGKHIRPVASVHDITSIQAEAEHLAEQLNRCQLSPIHLEEYISDFLAKIS